jgi:hypothetical protein
MHQIDASTAVLQPGGFITPSSEQTAYVLREVQTLSQRDT